MSDKGYLSKKREDQIAKILDASVDFKDILKDRKKLLGFVNLGTILEKNDRKLFRMLIAVIDDSINKNANPEKVKEFDLALHYLENEDIPSFNNHVSGILEKNLNIPYFDSDRQIYLAGLMLFNGIILKAVKKVELLIAEANAEA